MGERIACSFKVGGRITQAQAEELVQRANIYSSDGDVTLDQIGESWTFYEVNYGNLDELVDYCAEHGIDYEYWCDSGSDWDALRERVIGGEAISFPTGNNGPYVTLDDLTKLDALASGWAELHAKIKRWKEPLPKAEIVG